MGMLMSFMGGKGLSTTQMLNVVVGVLYNQFFDKEINDFDAFHVAILEIFNTINISLPGKHYDAPSHNEVENLFNQWKEADKKARKELFTDFIKKNVHLNKVDDSMMLTGILAPPAVMIIKKAGETVPQLSVMKAIPDVVFVPSGTVLALSAVKISRIIFMRKRAP